VAKATNKNIAAFFPFGMGPRTCLGFNYAIIEGKIALSMILQRYRFTLSPTYVHHPSSHSVSKAWYSSHSPAIISMVFKPSSHPAPCFIMSISNFLYVVSTFRNNRLNGLELFILIIFLKRFMFKATLTR